jgi:hypothetical protein
MRSKTTLILLAVGLLAALLFFLIEEPRHARDTARLAAEEHLTSVRAEDVGAVSIVRPDIEIRAVREGERWRITGPVADRADDGAVNVLVLTACRAAIERRFDIESSHLAEYGLALPAATLRFDAADGEKLLEVRIGDLNPSMSHCYAVSGEGREVVLLPAGLRRYALRSLFEFRDKWIVDVGLGDVASIEIRSRTGSMVWTAGEDGRWFAVEGADTVRGDKTAVENVVRRLRGLRARDIPFEPGEDVEARFTDRAGSIRLSTRGDPAGIELEFSLPQGDGCYVTSSKSGRTALVDTTLIPVFRRTLDEFRDKRILSFDEEVLTKITWSTPELTRTIVKKDGSWEYANPAFGTFKDATASRLLSKLSSIEFAGVLERRFEAASGHRLDTPVLRIALHDSDDRLIDEAVFGSILSDGASRAVWSRSTRTLGVLSEETASGLDDVLSAFGGP